MSTLPKTVAGAATMAVNLAKVTSTSATIGFLYGARIIYVIAIVAHVSATCSNSENAHPS